VCFHVSIVGGDVPFDVQTELSAAFLAKPVRRGLAASALEAYFKLDGLVDAERLKAYYTVDTLRLVIDGEEVDGTASASSFVKASGEPVSLVMAFPNHVTNVTVVVSR